MIYSKKQIITSTLILLGFFWLYITIIEPYPNQIRTAELLNLPKALYKPTLYLEHFATGFFAIIPSLLLTKLFSLKKGKKYKHAKHPLIGIVIILIIEIIYQFICKYNDNSYLQLTFTLLGFILYYYYIKWYWKNQTI
jgi:uncharacterized membrane protein